MVIKKLETTQTVEDFIEKGAEVCGKKEENKFEWTNFTLRIRKDLSQEIDNVLKNRIGISKTAWILEAIQQKLKT